MGLEYLDCYLIHFPVCLIPEATYPVKKEDIRPMDFEGVWAAMEECQKLGLTKTIGVSNFTAKKLERILATAKILPAVNQVSEIKSNQTKFLLESNFFTVQLARFWFDSDSVLALF